MGIMKRPDPDELAAARRDAEPAADEATKTSRVAGDELPAALNGEVAEVRETRAAAERMAALGQLAAGVSHEFKNLLWGIDLHAELIQGAAGASDQVREDASMIRDAVARGMTVSRQLMDFARPNPPLEAVDLGEAIRSVEPLLARLLGDGSRLVLDLAESGDRARIDRGRVEQILINLAMNAHDAMPDGGTVTLTTGEATIGDELAAELGIERGGYAVLTVADTGAGMAPATLERVFEPYFTTKEPGKGTGLGLATTFGVVRAAGGSISAESAPGRGTTFRILIPTSPEASSDAVGDA